MKANLMISLVCFLFLFIISEQSENFYYNYLLLHRNSELAKVCQLDNGNVLALSSGYNSQRTNITKFNKRGQKIYENYQLLKGYSGSSQLAATKDPDKTNSEYYLFGHNKQELTGRQPYENITILKDESPVQKDTIIKKKIYAQSSIVPLKSGYVVLAGVIGVTTFGAQTNVDINIYDPDGNFDESKGITFNSNGNLLSCYSQGENDVYCAFIIEENRFVSKLSLKHLKITRDTITKVEDLEILKNFYTTFNFVKAIPFRENEALILFQTGDPENEEINLGNSGQDLYFYHIEVSGGKINVLRYDYLFNKCVFKKDNEYYSADIIALTDNNIYAVCESQNNQLYLFSIFLDKKPFETFQLRNVDKNKLKNPVFAKFDKSLSLFYTNFTSSTNYNTYYTMINYPDCSDYSDSPALLPKYFKKTLSLEDKIFMGNPYPNERKAENITVRITDLAGITIMNVNTKEEVLLDTDFNSKTDLTFYAVSKEGEYDVEFTASRKEGKESILGRTCKITFNTPKCLEQCYSCNQTGNDAFHYCHRCKDKSYFESNHTDYIGEEFDKIHNCYKCDDACASCYGFPILTDELNTTNCKEDDCIFEEGFFPYEKEHRTCISKGTQEYWERIYDHGIYLDKSAGNDTKTWIWRNCHDNCKKCHQKGDDDDNKCDECEDGFYFFCNQTAGNGIPGSCHNDCLDNGFFLKKKEDGRNKCCPCFDNCKKCPDETKCDTCFKPFLLTPEKDKCNKTCGYCYAEDHDLGECVNCKTRYGNIEKYTLQNDTVNKCVNSLTFPVEGLGGKNWTHHVIDDQCNLIIGCKEGCQKCTPWYSDECTECKKDFYKEDFHGITPLPKDTFYCFNLTTCQGHYGYKHDDEIIRIGGVPIKEDGVNVCLNCKLRNESYRQPIPNIYCGTKGTRTYVKIEDYNMLDECYFRCKECDYEGNNFNMNCKSCRESTNYDYLEYNKKLGLGNCIRKSHPCGIYPYYHDYDIAEVLGIDEEDCGEKCDVCLYNFTCTERFPYFKMSTHECVEYCPVTEVFGKECTLNNSAGFLSLLRNPFGLVNPYEFLNTSISINNLIDSGLFLYIANTYNLDVNEIKKNINNYIGNGKVYNLPESLIISGNNISIELSTIKLELEKLEKALNGETDDGDDVGNSGKSILDISECEKILKKKYNLPDEEDLIIIKGEELKHYTETFLGVGLEYQLFSTSLGAFLPLSDCQKEGTTVTISNTFSNPFNSSSLLSLFQSKTAAVVSDDSDPFNYSSPFFNDICTPFTNENGNDVLLDARRQDYLQENPNDICEPGCKFSGYNAARKLYTCVCNIKAAPGDEITPLEKEYVTKEMPEGFKDLVSRRSNIAVFKCASQVFSSKGQSKNFGSYILLVGLVSFIGVVVFHFLKERKAMDTLFNNLSKIPIKANPPNPHKEKNDKKKDTNDKNRNNVNAKNEGIKVQLRGINSKGSATKRDLTKEKPKNILKDMELTNEQLNYASYDIASEKDTRSILRIYWSYLKVKQLFIFTFYTSGDYILRSTKIALFILFIGFYLTFTALFFNDSIMRAIYIYKGNTNAAVHIPNIVLSSLCCLIANLIIRFISLNERDISKLVQINDEDKRKNLADRMKKISNIKLIILYCVSGALLALFWYYVSAFCAVFKNSQGHYFINVLVSFIICNLWPCFISLIPAFLRKKAIDKRSEIMYNVSQIISYF